MKAFARWVVRRIPVRLRPGARRTRRLQALLSKEGKGLEIGPCHNGVAPRRDGWNVTIVDHLDQTGLRAKYAEHGIDLERIEFVDHVWRGEDLSDLVGNSRFDWVVASHVAEHVPDLLRFFRGALTALVPGGRLILVLPDHRRCFDALRYPSGLAQVLDAWREGRVRPTPGAVAEHHFRAAARLGRRAWPFWWPGRLKKIHTDAEAAERYVASLADDLYRDVHVWCFTPSSFSRLMRELTVLELLKARLVEGPVDMGHEFVVVFESLHDSD